MRPRIARLLPALLAILPANALAQQPATDNPPDQAPPAPDQRSAKPYKKPEPISFVRLRPGASGRPAALQVAHVRYVPTDGSNLAVTLYSAVHVGDQGYYEDLNRAFRRHDALLFELANDPDALNELDTRRPSVFSLMQFDFAEMLGLAKQLDQIDYNRPNFVHADIPIDQLVQHAQDEGEDLLTVTAQTLLDVRRMLNRGVDPLGGLPADPGAQSPPADPFAQLFGGVDDPRALKRQLAEQLASQTADGILEGITVLNRYLIGARNRRCMEVLDEQIAKGKRDIGIFYGAGHNPDFHRRLMADYGLKPVKVTWVEAWDLNAEIKRSSSKGDELSDEELLMQLMRRLMEGGR